jgi:hypothetical protein
VWEKKISDKGKKTWNRSTVDLGGGGGRNVMENLMLSFADDYLWLTDCIQ